MKKIKLIKYLAFSFLLVGMWSCDGIFDDAQPSTQISVSDALETEAGVNGVRSSMYAKLLGSFDLTTEYMVGPGALADETFNRPGSTRFNALNNSVSTSGTAHISPFGGAYELIQDANLIINSIPDGVLDDATRDQYRGEALALRAWAYHTLVRALGYEPGNFSNGPTAGFNLGVMLRTDATLDLSDAEPIARNTVDEIYTQVRADLASAITLLTASSTGAVTGRNGFATMEFAMAMQARVELYAGEWGAASTAAQAAITASGLTLVSDSAAIGTMFAMANPEALFEIKVNASTEAIAGGNTNSGLAAYTSDQWVAQVPTNYVLDLYDAADNRLQGWYNDCIAQQTSGATANGCASINDEGFSVTKWNGWKGNFVDDIPYFRIAELYLIQAEAAAKSAGIAAGIAPLNTLRAARGLGPVAAGDFANITAFEDEILNERTRELVVEGHRFWDLKRLGRDIPSGVSADLKMRSDSFRILAPFGTTVQNVNPLLVENPEYEVSE